MRQHKQPKKESTKTMMISDEYHHRIILKSAEKPYGKIKQVLTLIFNRLKCVNN